MPEITEVPGPARRKKTWVRSILFIGILVLLIAAFTVLGVSRVLELGSTAFFFVVTAGVLVLLCFFCGFIAYARSKLLAVHDANDPSQNAERLQSIPVFYFLETIHRTIPQEPIPDDEYWCKDDDGEGKVQEDLCPICLCDMDKVHTATGISSCCRREIHIKCAQDYFNSIRRVKCVFCRQDHEEAANMSMNTTCPSPPVPEQSIHESSV
jgi:hypothetical protein